MALAAASKFNTERDIPANARRVLHDGVQPELAAAAGAKRSIVTEASHEQLGSRATT